MNLFLNDKIPSILLANRQIQTTNCAFVMGILNVNTDSFFSNSRTNLKYDNAIDKAQLMIDQGADIIDIGAESTRPGSEYISEEEELNRLVPIVQEIRKNNSQIAISIDTRKTKVIEECVNAGADILNDVSALEDGKDICSFVAQSKIPVILMHKKGIPVSMQKNINYADVVKEVSQYLISRAEYAVQNGVSKDKIIFDPGIGFSKNIENNIDLIVHLNELVSAWNNGKNHILMALSRKSFIGEILDKNVDDRLYGSLSAEMFSILNGASIVRVHDVEPTIDCIKVLSSIIKRGFAK